MRQTSGDFPLPTSATTEQEVYDDPGTQKPKTDIARWFVPRMETARP